MGILSWNYHGGSSSHSSICISFFLEDTWAYSETHLQKICSTHMLCMPWTIHLLVNPGKSCPTLQMPGQLLGTAPGVCWVLLTAQAGVITAMLSGLHHLGYFQHSNKVYFLKNSTRKLLMMAVCFICINAPNKQ